jgi:L-threonylcarbamoyladenylate synthase
MKIIKLSKALKDLERVRLAKAVREGKILIYPTDTLYGIGCNAEKTESVERIMKAKGRDSDKPLSIIAPSKEWIAENTKIMSDGVKFINNLFPGPYTVILKARIKIPFVVSKEGKIGIRIPKDEFCDFIRSQGSPFVTTSVNLSEENPVYFIEQIPKQMKQIADYAIDAGEIKGHASRVFDVSGRRMAILRW